MTRRSALDLRVPPGEDLTPEQLNELGQAMLAEGRKEDYPEEMMAAALPPPFGIVWESDGNVSSD